MSGQFVEIFNIIMTAFTSIAVAYIGIYQSRRKKATEEYRTLQQENERLRAEEAARQTKEIQDQISNLNNSVSKLSEDVKSLQSCTRLDDIQDEVEQIHALNEVNFEYIRTLSNTLVIIGKTLSSNSSTLQPAIKDKIEDEIDKHQEKENDITKKLYNIVV